MNRRTFMKVAATTTASFVLPAYQCTPEAAAVPPQSPALVPTVTPTATPARTIVTLPGTETWNLVSRINGQEYRIFVDLPKGYDTTERFPVIYLTDGNGNFPLAHILHNHLKEEKYIPPAFLVGVDYPFDDYDVYKALRTRDFVPPSPGGTGGAAAFLRFLREELKPVIDAKYHTQADDATLVGHSLGGLFALYALFQEPAMFRRYIVGSPSIFWNGKAILNEMAAFAKIHTDLPAHVFMGIGGGEGAMVPDMLDMADKLTGYRYPSFTLTKQVFEAETHLSVIPFYLSHGLREYPG